MIINTLRKKNFSKKILNFIHYLRHIILIFILLTVLVFTIPKVLKHVNKFSELNNILKNQHGFTIKKSDNIKYKIFPQPNLEIQDSQISIGKQLSNLKMKELKVFTNLKGLYVSEEIFFKKLKFKGNYFGYDINGYYTPKKDVNLLFLQFKDLGIESKVFLNKNNIFPQCSGTIKLNILDDSLLINFDFDRNFKFKDSVFKNKNINTNLSGQLDFKPFFYFKIFADIKRANLENIKLEKLYQIIINEISNKKLNGEISINYLTKKKFVKNSIKSNKINLVFKNGDIISKNSVIQFSNLNIEINFFLKKYPLYKDLSYELLIKSENINKFLKTIDLDENKNWNKINAFIKGNININAQKHYFDKIIINQKNIGREKLVQLKNYLDKNTINYFDVESKKNFFNLFLKDLIEFILA